MQAINSSVVVLPSFSEFGIVSKEDRGIVAGQGKLPEALLAMQSKLSRVASRLGVDASLPAAERNVAIKAAYASRVTEESLPVPKHPERDLSGPSM